MSTISKATRYRAGLDEDGIVCHREQENGKWVKYEDYEAIEAELLTLRKEREKAEPVAWRIDPNEGPSQLTFRCDDDLRQNGLLKDVDKAIPLYTAPPAPVSPDEKYQHLSELYHGQEKRLFKIAQRIKGPSFDKYAYSPSQAIDVLEAAIFGENNKDCRAAMLQPAQTETDTTAQQFESLAGKAVSGSEGFECTPVADLYELLTKCGECYDYTTSAKVASDWIKEGYSAREYVKLDRLQEALLFAAPEPCK
ncbi:hypothetical protein ACOZ12_001941 [Cronobacter turicensis]